MPTVADTITVPSGAGVYGGRFPPVPPSLTWTAPSPAGSEVGVASGNFTATLVDGVAAVVVTPISTLAGTWAPSSRTLSPAAPGGTFTFTPAAAGSHSATLANNAGIASPAALSYVVTVPTVRAMTFAAADTATVNVAVSGSITNTGNVSQAWSITPPSGVTVTPSSGTLAAGATQALSITATAAATYSLTLAASGATIAGNPQSIVTSPAPATGFSLTGPTSGTTGSPATFTVTPLGGPLSAAATVNLTAPGATLSTASLSFASGATAGQTFTVNRATDGTTSVSMTNTLGLTNGSAISFTSVAPVAPGTVFTTLTLSGADGAAKPFTVGHAFKQGDVPAGSSVVMTGASVNGQATIKSTWPDGSAKIAVLAGTANIASGTASLSIASGPAATGTALTTADLIATGITASVDAGAFGSASFGSTEWAAPFQAWVSGPRMSSWVYRKAVGSDAHLVAWLEVRLYAGGAVEVLPWVENGYLNVAGPGAKSATYTFTLGGTVRNGGGAGQAIDLLHHQRTPLVSGSALSYWLATDPGVTPNHDSAYLMATEIVPTYSATVGPSDALITALPATYTPLQQGSFTYASDAMPSPGFAEPIGLLPQHDILGLVSTANTYASVVRNGYSAGRYPIYYRDEATNKPVKPLDRPGICIPPDRGIYSASGAYAGGTNTPATTGGHGPGWETAHHPSVGFMAYLLTGRFYHCETTQFATAINFLARANLAVQRGTAGEGYLIVDPGSVGVRDCAWAWRTLAQALTATPDGDSWRTAWLTVAQNNIDHYHARYVAQANNPLGYIQAGTAAYDGTLGTTAPWMHDFMTSAWGYSALQGLPLATGYQAKLEAFFAFTAKSITHRLGGVGGDWHWQNPAVYTAKVSANSSPDWNTGTGPFYSASEAYAATFATPPAWLASTSGNTIGDENLPGSPEAAMRSFLGNLIPAISYAVRLGAAGALDGYYRLTGADNWATLAAAQNGYPGWAVAPASSAIPAWLSGAAVGEWLEIAGTAVPAGTAVDAFSGLGVRENTAELFILAAGGHFNSSDNRAISLDLTASAPTWTQRIAASSSVQQDVPFYSDGKPSSRHTYYTTHWVPHHSRMMLVGAPYVYGTAVSFQDVTGYNPAGPSWDADSTYSDTPAAGVFGAVKDGDGNIWSEAGARKWDVATDTWSTAISPPGNETTQVRFPWAYDSLRDQLFGLCLADGQGFTGWGTNLRAVKMSCAGTPTQVAVTFNASAALDDLIADDPEYAGMDYDAANDRFLFYDGYSTRAGRCYIVTPNSGTTWDVSVLTLGAGSATPPSTPGTKGINFSGICSRFRYIDLGSVKGFVLLPQASSNLYFLRTA